MFFQTFPRMHHIRGHLRRAARIPGTPTGREKWDQEGIFKLVEIGDRPVNSRGEAAVPWH